MKYKIYRIVGNGYNEGSIKMVIEDSEFEFEVYDSIEEAVKELEQRGEKYTNYTILPHIFLNDNYLV